MEQKSDKKGTNVPKDLEARKMERKIYFCGSIRGGRNDAQLYAKLIDELKNYGKVLTEVIGNPYIEEVDHDIGETREKRIYDQGCRWLKESDVVIAEATQPSLGVGFEIGTAIALNKKVLVLFRPDTGRLLSSMISGACNGENVILRKYKEEEIPSIFQTYFSNIDNCTC